MKTIALLLSTLLLAACGQTGPLVLPEKNPDPRQQTDKKDQAQEKNSTP